MLLQPFFQGKDQVSKIFHGQEHLYFCLILLNIVPFLIQLRASKQLKTSQESIYLIPGQ